MRRINSLFFIPSSPKFFDFSQTEGDSVALLTLEEKIRRDPTQRERLRCEARFSGINKESKNRLKKKKRQVFSAIPQEGVSSIPTAEDVNVDTSQYNDEDIVYLKNMTETELILDFNPNVILENGQRPPKPKTVKYFLPIWELTKEELHSPILETFYRKKMLIGVTEARYHTEMAEIRKNEQIEVDLLARKRAQAANDRIVNPHRDTSSLRRLGGIDMNVIDTGIGTTDDLDGISLDAQTGDGGVIHFDLGPQSGTVNPRSERTETEILSDLVSPGQSQDGGVTAGDMSSMFSVGEFKEHSN